MKLLNLGCGKHYHKNWINIDFNKTGENVIAYNLLNGIPYKENDIDVIYNSHLFEHFNKHNGINFIKECYRVLKPNGILRIVVPDLEGIVKEYLLQLEKSLLGDKNAQTNYEWIVIEMIDQMIRNKSGGEMINYIMNKNIVNKNYIIDRIGIEANDLLNTNYTANTYYLKKNNNQKLLGLISRFRVKFAKIILGNESHLIDIGKFRTIGENHLWMYDRYSLSKLLQECHFSKVNLTDVFHSMIPNWEQQNLDLIDGKIRQPNSLYIEAIK